MTTTDVVMTKFLRYNCFYLIYPLILCVGVTIESLFSPEYIDSVKITLPLTESSNKINLIFAYGGNKIFLILFIGLNLIKILELLENRILNNPNEEFSHSIKQISNTSIIILINSLVKFTINFTLLHFIFKFIDHIFFQTGGRCIVTQSVANALASSANSFDECLKYNGTWVRLKDGFCSLTPNQFAEVIKSAEVCKSYGTWSNGFDISGHFCFLITISLVIFNELRNFNNEINLNEKSLQNSNNNWSSLTYVSCWKWISIVTLVIWASLLFVTSIFYHTFEEKLFGMLFGYISPLFIYVALPRTPLSSILN